MDIQTTILNGVASILAIFVSVFFAMMTAYIKQHFTSKQINDAGGIALEAVNFATQVAKKYGLSTDSAKFANAMTRAKELAEKAGINLSDSQWETLIESAYKKAKNELAGLVTDATPYTSDEIVDMIAKEVSKAVPVPPDVVAIVKQELGKMQMSVNVVSAPVVASEPVKVVQSVVAPEVAQVAPQANVEPAKEEKEGQTS